MALSVIEKKVENVGSSWVVCISKVPSRANGLPSL